MKGKSIKINIQVLKKILRSLRKVKGLDWTKQPDDLCAAAT